MPSTPCPAAVRSPTATATETSPTVVVEERRGQFGPGAESVAAAPAGAGVDRVGRLAQPVHVPADRAWGDTEPVGRSGPDRDVLNRPARFSSRSVQLTAVTVTDRSLSVV